MSVTADTIRVGLDVTCSLGSYTKEWSHRTAKYVDTLVEVFIIYSYGTPIAHRVAFPVSSDTHRAMQKTPRPYARGFLLPVDFVPVKLLHNPLT